MEGNSTFLAQALPPGVIPSQEADVVPLAAWPRLTDDALCGIMGDIVRAATLNSEADPAAVLFTGLTWAGIAFGASPCLSVGDSTHPPRLFTVICGATGKARKGTSADPIRRIMKAAASIAGGSARWGKANSGPLSSGEGLVHAVRDASDEVIHETQEPKDPGVTDKRLLTIETEFGAALRAAQRDGSTLSAILRMAWDSGDIEPLTKTNRERTTGAHIGIVAHITRRELDQLLAKVDLWNGFANRFLWVCARRSKKVPLPKPIDAAELNRLAKALAGAIEFANETSEISLDDEAEALWVEMYDALTEDGVGVLSAVTTRAEAQVLRLALVYALLDRSPKIRPQHLKAAAAAWQYCMDSARFIFGSEVESGVSELTARILQALAAGPCTRTQLFDACNRNLSKAQLTECLVELQSKGKIERTLQKAANNRTIETWHLIKPNEFDEFDEKRQ